MSPTISIGDLVTSVAYLVICIVGLVGNLLAIYVIIRYTRMKTVTNLYILNLSISDAIFLLDLPLIIVGGLLKRWIFGVALCKIYFATSGINMFTGSFTLAVLSGDRYLAVCHPSKAVVYRTVKNARIVILLTWVISVILLAPIIAYADIFPQDSPTDFTANFSAIKSPSSSPLPKSSQPDSNKWDLISGDVTPLSLINNYYMNKQQKLQQEKTPFIDSPHQRPLLYANPYRSQVDESSKSLYVTAATEKHLPQKNKRLKRQQKSLNRKMQIVTKSISANLSSMFEVTRNFKHLANNDHQPAKRMSGNDDGRIKTVLNKKFETTTVVNDENGTILTLQVINSSTYTCTIDWPSSFKFRNAYIAYTLIIGFIIPVFIISILYTTLVIKLSKDPSSSDAIGFSETSANHNAVKESFPQRMKRTFLSKESSIGKQSDVFKNSIMSKQTPSPITPSIPENQVLLYRTPPEVLKNIGHRLGDDEKAMTEKEEEKTNKTNPTIRSHETKTETAAIGRPLSVSRNISAFKQRRMQQPRITRLVTSIILVYVVCWLPYWAFQLHLLTNEMAIRESRWKLTLYHFFTFLSYCNSAINPILYVFTNQNFRDSFVSAVQCQKDLRPGIRGVNGRYKNINNNKKTNSCKARLEKQNGVTRHDLKRFNSCTAAVTHTGDVIRANNDKLLRAKRGNLLQNYAGQLSLQESRRYEDFIVINTSSSVQPVDQNLVSDVDVELKKSNDVAVPCSAVTVPCSAATVPCSAATVPCSARTQEIVERNLINTNFHSNFEGEKVNLQN